jgi:hypothetical protein
MRGPPGSGQPAHVTLARSEKTYESERLLVGDRGLERHERLGADGCPPGPVGTRDFELRVIILNNNNYWDIDCETPVEMNAAVECTSANFHVHGLGTSAAGYPCTTALHEAIGRAKATQALPGMEPGTAFGGSSCRDTLTEGRRSGPFTSSESPNGLGPAVWNM